MKCRFCGNELKQEFIDLVNSPPSNSYLTKEQLNEPEIFYPLKVYVCEECFLVQIDEYKKSQEIFDKDYAYFSSYSLTWLKHSKEYADMITERLGLNKDSLVVEIASNDGYLLQYFKEKNIPVLGIEPASNTAQVAKEKGIETIERLFYDDLAEELIRDGKSADLIVGNNVLAHNPYINKFVSGLKILLKPQGVITMEFPHFMQLVSHNQFDTIYHEHFSYLSFTTVKKIFEAHGLELFDVEELPTHGGSLRIYAKHAEDNSKPISNRVYELFYREDKVGIKNLDYYKNFQDKANKIKHDLLTFLTEQKQCGKKVVAYGAAAKGNTLINYCGIKKDLVEFVVDASPHKRGKFLPGSHIPIVNEERIKEEKPDYVLILPWNIREEIMKQLNYIRDWGGKFVVAIPKMEIID